MTVPYLMSNATIPPITNCDHASDGWRIPCVKALEAEMERLRDLLVDQAVNSPIYSVGLVEGGIEVAVKPPHWAVKALAASFLDTLGDAKNWRTLELGPIPSDGGMLVATVYRKAGDSPTDTVFKLRKALLDVISEAKNKDSEAVKAAMELINPVKEV